MNALSCAPGWTRWWTRARFESATRAREACGVALSCPPQHALRKPPTIPARIALLAIAIVLVHTRRRNTCD